MKTKEEIIKAMESIGCEVCSYEDYIENNLAMYYHAPNMILYFKEKLQTVFEDEQRRIKIDEVDINIENLRTGKSIGFNKGGSLPLLIKAVDQWKKLYGGKK